MIVYRDTPGESARAIWRELLPRLESGESSRDVLIELGEIEAAAEDAGSPTPALTALLMRVARHCDPRPGLRALANWEPDAGWKSKPPEGYAYYALYPESYRAAARTFCSSVPARHVTCIGVRSIGASLSAVVAAALEHAGLDSLRFTVRPDGHPFNRHLDWTDTQHRIVLERAAGWFAVVDEGPGLSGSTFAAVADALSRLGIPDSRIVFFPSWDADAAVLLSVRARAIWPRHQKFIGCFQPSIEGEDWSAGRWRESFSWPNGHWPAVQPQHERRKIADRDRVWRFAGLGRFGRNRLRRAELLYDAGFGSRPGELRDGYLSLDRLSGWPEPAPSATFLQFAARYAAHLRRRFPAPAASHLTAMVETNIHELLGPEWMPALRQPAGDPVAVDGRMLRHEWITTSRGIFKTDALDHGDDHFFPGPVDIAWDLAGLSVEFRLDEAGRSYLIEQYERMSGDGHIWDRLQWHRIAYLAFRAAYASSAATAVSDPAEQSRWAAQRERYLKLLREDLLQTDLVQPASKGAPLWQAG